MGLPQNAFQWNMQPSSSISFGTTTQTLKVGSSATVSISGLVYQEKIRLPLSGSIILGTTTQTLSVGASATVTQSGAWPVARAARVHKNGTGQVVSSGVYTKLTFSTSDFDSMAIFDNANDRITPNVAGKWSFTGLITAALDADTRIIAALRKNGSTAAANNRQAFTWIPIGSSVNAIIQGFFDMNGTTDYVELFVFQENGADRTVNGGQDLTYLEAVYMGA